MESNPTHKRFIARMIGYGIGLYAVIVLFTILWRLPSIRWLPVGGAENITIGPFTLFEVHKAADAGGYAITVAARPGMVGLLALCVLLELGLAWMVVRGHLFSPDDKS
jgi:hypothetical protein